MAESVGMPPEQVFKTLCCREIKRAILFAVIRGNGELDLKALAKASGNKKTELVHLRKCWALPAISGAG